MTWDKERFRQAGFDYRERLAAAGRMLMNIHIPNDLVEVLDRLKEQRGLRGRSEIIEEALRLYIEKHEGT